MCTKDAVKARIKKLEGDLLGLVERLKRLGTQPGLFSNPTQAFNARSKRKSLHSSFQNANMMQDQLKIQIMRIRDELTSLRAYDYDAPEFRMAA